MNSPDESMTPVWMISKFLSVVRTITTTQIIPVSSCTGYQAKTEMRFTHLH